jgi:hypothetical protein
MEENMIDKTTSFADIKENDQITSVLEEIMKVKKINPGFTKRDTVENISKKLGIDLMDLLLILNKKNRTEKEFYEAYPQMKIKDDIKKPQWLEKNDMVDLDVRDSLAKGVDPFGLIMQTVATLDGRILHIINSFEPAPLYSVLGKQGFMHYAENQNGVWHIYFYKKQL